MASPSEVGEGREAAVRGLVGLRYAFAVALLAGLAAAPVIVVVSAGQAALDRAVPPAEAPSMPFLTPADAPVVVEAPETESAGWSARLGSRMLCWPPAGPDGRKLPASHVVR
jgi:hypothetical protein